MTGTRNNHQLSFQQLRREDLTVLGKQIVRPPNQKLGHERNQLFELFLACFLLFRRGIRISSLQDSILKILPKLQSRTQDTRIRKVQKGEVFSQIILNWRAGEQNASLNVDGTESGISVVLGILESMCFVC